MQSDKRKAIHYLEKGLRIDDIFTAFLDNSLRPVKKTTTYNEILKELKTNFRKLRNDLNYREVCFFGSIHCNPFSLLPGIYPDYYKLPF